MPAQETNSPKYKTKAALEEKRKSQIENYVGAYNHFDVDGMVADLSPDVVFENISNGAVNLRTEGVEAFRQQATAATAYFTEREQTVESWTFTANTIVIDIAYRALLATDLPNGMKRGETLLLTGQSEFQFADGRIVRITDRS